MIDTILTVIPTWLMDGFKIAGGLLPVVGFAIHQRDADRREEAADDDPRDALRRHVEHPHEQAEEEDGRAEVALHDEDPL